MFRKLEESLTKPMKKAVVLSGFLCCSAVIMNALETRQSSDSFDGASSDRLKAFFGFREFVSLVNMLFDGVKALCAEGMLHTAGIFYSGFGVHPQIDKPVG